MTTKKSLPHGLKFPRVSFENVEKLQGDIGPFSREVRLDGCSLLRTTISGSDTLLKSGITGVTPNGVSGGSEESFGEGCPVVALARIGATSENWEAWEASPRARRRRSMPE